MADATTSEGVRQPAKWQREAPWSADFEGRRLRFVLIAAGVVALIDTI
jgi:hypothetical protein